MNAPAESQEPTYPPVFLLAAIIQAPHRYLGIILLAAGLAVVLWAAGIFERAGTIIKPVEIASLADTCLP